LSSIEQIKNKLTSMPEKKKSNSSSSVSLSSDHSSDISEYQKDNNKILQKSEAQI
jgi:hypothetical protein